jgi:hypothetical protein
MMENEHKIFALCQRAKSKKAFTANTTLLRGLKSFTEFKFVRFARILFCCHVPRAPITRFRFAFSIYRGGV